MLTRSKRFNSKAFLLIYLLLIATLLLSWVSRFAIHEPDTRQLPAPLTPFLTSPPRAIPQFLLYKNKKQVLTNSFFANKWTFVYFAFGHCSPACDPALQKIRQLRSAYANPDVQFAVIGIDTEHESAAQWQQFITRQQLQAAAATTHDQDMIELISRAFEFLYLQTTYQNGNYQIEQQQDLFLVDPKGRVYARFKDTVTAAQIQVLFAPIRSFYARSE